jgi:hypothetical protein
MATESRTCSVGRYAAHWICVKPNTLGKVGGCKSNVRCSGTSILCGYQSFSFRGAPGCYLAVYGIKRKFPFFVPVFELGTVFLAESIVLYYGSVQMGGVYVRYCEKMNNGRNCIHHPFSFFPAT